MLGSFWLVVASLAPVAAADEGESAKGRIDSILGEAKKATEKRLWIRARTLLRKAKRLDPDRADIRKVLKRIEDKCDVVAKFHYQEAKSQMALENFAAAESSCREAMRYHDDQYDEYNGRCRELLGTKVQSASKASQMSEAEFRQLLLDSRQAVDSKNWIKARRLIRAASRGKKKNEELTRLFEQIDAACSRQAAHHFDRARFYYSDRDYEMAAEECSMAVQYDDLARHPSHKRCRNILDSQSNGRN
jgi:hypothetical protein